jgi:hypothetical protein
MSATRSHVLLARARPTSRPVLRNEKDRVDARSFVHRRCQRRTRMRERSVSRRRTDFHVRVRVCALSPPGLRVVASVTCGVGDDLQPDHLQRLATGVVVSHAAIAAVLAREDLSSGERLAAFA